MSAYKSDDLSKKGDILPIRIESRLLSHEDRSIFFFFGISYGGFGSNSDNNRVRDFIPVKYFMNCVTCNADQDVDEWFRKMCNGKLEDWRSRFSLKDRGSIIEPQMKAFASKDNAETSLSQQLDVSLSIDLYASSRRTLLFYHIKKQEDGTYAMYYKFVSEENLCPQMMHCEAKITVDYHSIQCAIDDSKIKKKWLRGAGGIARSPVNSLSSSPQSGLNEKNFKRCSVEFRFSSVSLNEAEI